MPFLDHLEELRWHLIRSILAIVIAGAIIVIATSYACDEYHRRRYNYY